MANADVKRRDFLAASLGLGAVTAGRSFPLDAVPALAAEAEAPESQSRDRESKPYGVQYYERISSIWEQISSSELPTVAEAADRAVASLKNNGKLYCLIVGGHMHLAELRQDRPGNPDYLHNWSRHINPQKFDAVGKGDFVLFDHPKDYVRKARDRGAFTVGMRVPYHANQTTPKGVLGMNELAANPVFADVLLPEECSSAVLTTHVPFTDGVLYIPEIPAVRACGSSPQGTFNLYWMLTAEIAMRHKGGGAMGSTERAQEFMQIVKDRGAKIRGNLDQIDAVAKAMVEYVSHGAKYWNFPLRGNDENSKLEPWSIMVEENTNRASGLVMSKTLELADLEKKAKKGDFVFIAAEASDVKEDIAAAQAFKRAGLKVIYIGPTTEGSAAQDLPSVADWHIDTLSPERDGVLRVSGFDKKICPTTGVMYALAQYMVNAQFIGHMIKADMTPLLFMGMHLIGGRAYYDVVQKIYESRGY
jgi:uncharacterized phosphosugar-binding protein